MDQIVLYHNENDIQTFDQCISMLCDDGLYNHFGCYTTPQKDALFPFKVSDKEILLLPAPEFSTLLYRGQNKYFEICKPTLLRAMKSDEKNISILQKMEFIQAIKIHPLTKIFQETYLLEKYPFPKYKLKIDYEAIAQHYEFKTNHLDFTRDKEIAMFFMTCKYEQNLKKYAPIVDNSIGILYSYDFKLGMLEDKHLINPIGFQPFSRPDKQKAFSIAFNKNINFNDFNFFTKEEFVLTKELSEKYFAMFDGGEKLLPKDEVSGLAYQIQQSKYISKDTIEIYLNNYQCSKKSIEKILQDNGYCITDNTYGFNIHNKNLFQQNCMNIFNDLDNRISPRGISQHLEYD